MIRRCVSGLALGILFVVAPCAQAQEQAPEGKVLESDVKTWILNVDGADWAARPAAPTFAGDTGLIRLSTAYTLPKAQFSFSYYYNNLDRDPKDIDFGTHGVTLGFGATDRLEIFGSIGLQARTKVAANEQGGFFNDLPFAGTDTSSPGWQQGFGDIWVGGKYKFLDDYRGDDVGLGLRAQFKLPTADEAKGLGTGKFSSAFDLVLSKSLNRKADLHASVGFKTHSSPDPQPAPTDFDTVPNYELSSAFVWGIGLNVPANRRVALQAEIVGTSYTKSETGQTNPIDLAIGASVWLGKGWFFRPAYSVNLNFDDRGLNSGVASYSGLVASIGYHPGTPGAEVYVPPPPPPPPVNKAPTVGCKPDKSEILPGERVTCRATGSDPDGDPLTYRWSASAGKVSGDGASATFDSAGVTAPATVTVSVEVSDGRGGTAKGDCASIRIKEPPRPEPIKCTSGGFPRNSERLNNVDKACLDDVASRLRQDPRGRVMIIGHADSKERHTEVVGKKPRGKPSCAKAFRSMPEQKPRPAPVRTAAVSPLSSSSRSTADSRLCASAELTAFRASGRFKVMRSTRPRTSLRTSSAIRGLLYLGGRRTPPSTRTTSAFM